MKTIEIVIADKIATPVGSPYIVCGNDNYVINFTFDSEWGGKPQKTARFKYLKDGETEFEDITFNGTVCPVPILTDITEVKIGVYAGELETTTPARVECRKSILCGDGTHEAPSEDVYNQLIEAINTGLVKGDKGDIGEQGVSGVYFGSGDMPEGYDIQIDPTGEVVVIDQEYNAESSRAQSGKAVAQALEPYVQFTDFPNEKEKTAGVIKVNSHYGIFAGKLSEESPENGDCIAINKATEKEIDNKSNSYKPIVPSCLDYAVKKALTNTTTHWTDDDKQAVRELLGVTSGGVEPTTTTILDDNLVPTTGGSIVQNETLEEGKQYTWSFYSGELPGQLWTNKKSTAVRLDSIPTVSSSGTYIGFYNEIPAWWNSETWTYRVYVYTDAGGGIRVRPVGIYNEDDSANTHFYEGDRISLYREDYITVASYSGEYEVTPTTEVQTLETEGLKMTDDVTVEQIPYSETSNDEGGTTVTIGG